MTTKSRNSLLESDGLVAETDTHEWFRDVTTTDYAQRPNVHGEKLPFIFAFVLRNKKTGEYDRVLFDSRENAIIYDNGSVEGIGAQIDRMKAVAAFAKQR